MYYWVSLCFAVEIFEGENLTCNVNLLISFHQVLYLNIFRFSSVAQSCPTLCDPMNCSTPGLPVHHPEFTQTHVHGVGDAIQPSHPLSSPSPPAANPSQHQSHLSQFFAWGGQSIGISAFASILPKNPLTLLVGMQTSTATMENSVKIL